MFSRDDTSLNVRNDPVSMVLSGRKHQREMCEGLELLADQLGNYADQRLCSMLLQFLRLELPVQHRDEEAVFDLLRGRQAGDSIITGWIEQAVLEHRRHIDYALELAEPLSQLAADGRPKQIEALGYMLRCAFESMRRHLDWEEITLFSGFVQLVDENESQILAAKIARNHSLSAPYLRAID